MLSDLWVQFPETGSSQVRKKWLPVIKKAREGWAKSSNEQMDSTYVVVRSRIHINHIALKSVGYEFCGTLRGL